MSLSQAEGSQACDRLSLRSLVNAKCKECVYDPLAAGTWRAQVAQCGGVNCPLYPARPVPVSRAA